MAVELLCNICGMDGWAGWLEGLRAANEASMRLMYPVLDAGKGSTIVQLSNDQDSPIVDSFTTGSFDQSIGGMSVLVHIHITSHPAYAAYIPHGNTKRAMMNQQWKYGAEEHFGLLCPGWIFGERNPSGRITGRRSSLHSVFWGEKAVKIETATARFRKSICQL